GSASSQTRWSTPLRRPALRARLRFVSDPVAGRLELLDGHEHRPGLRALRRADDASAFEQVHEPPGSGEAHPELALQHAGRPQPLAPDGPHGPGQELVAVAVGRAPGTAPGGGVVTGDALDIRRCAGLATPVRDPLPDALLVDPGALDALGPPRARGEQQH